MAVRRELRQVSTKSPLPPAGPLQPRLLSHAASQLRNSESEALRGTLGGS